MSFPCDETGKEESCLQPISTLRWCGLTVAGKFNALRETIFRCQRGFMEHYRELKKRVEALESTAVFLLDKRVSELEREAEKVTFDRGAPDRPVMMVDGEPFTEDDVRCWRRMEKPARDLARIFGKQSWYFPAVRQAMRELAEAFYG